MKENNDKKLKNNVIDLYKELTTVKIGDKKTTFTLKGKEYIVFINIDDVTIKKHGFKNNELLAVGTHYAKLAAEGINRAYATYYNTMFVFKKTEDENCVIISIDDIIKSDFEDGKKV